MRGRRAGCLLLLLPVVAGGQTREAHAGAGALAACRRLHREGVVNMLLMSSVAADVCVFDFGGKTGCASGTESFCTPRLGDRCVTSHASHRQLVVAER
jgi:hypothetical protein